MENMRVCLDDVVGVWGGHIVYWGILYAMWSRESVVGIYKKLIVFINKTHTYNINHRENIERNEH